MNICVWISINLYGFQALYSFYKYPTFLVVILCLYAYVPCKAFVVCNFDERVFIEFSSIQFRIGFHFVFLVFWGDFSLCILYVFVCDPLFFPLSNWLLMTTLQRLYSCPYYQSILLSLSRIITNYLRCVVVMHFVVWGHGSPLCWVWTCCARVFWYVHSSGPSWSGDSVLSFCLFF